MYIIVSIVYGVSKGNGYQSLIPETINVYIVYHCFRFCIFGKKIKPLLIKEEALKINAKYKLYEKKSLGAPENSAKEFPKAVRGGR